MSDLVVPASDISTFGNYNGIKGADGATDGAAGSDGQSLTAEFDDEDLGSYPQSPLVTLISGGQGGAGQSDGRGSGGAGGNGGDVASTIVNPALGSAAVPYAGIFGLQQGAQGGAGGTSIGGGPAGNGGSASVALSGLQSVGEAGTELQLQANGGQSGLGLGNGGDAQAELNGSTITDSTSIVLEADANYGSGALGGSDGTASANIDDNTISAPQVMITDQVSNASNAGNVSFQFNNVSVSDGGWLGLNFFEYLPFSSTAVMPDNLQLSGNNFAGGANSTLNIASVSKLYVDSINHQLVFQGSATAGTNTMNGFTSFNLGTDDTLVVGTGSYTAYFSAEPNPLDTLVYTPQSGNIAISNFGTGNILDLQGFGSLLDAQELTSDTSIINGNTVITVANAGTITLVGLTTPIPAADIEFTTACYLRGTSIATPSGGCAIDALAIGDSVLTASGETRQVVWLGRRTVDLERHPDPVSIWPVLVRADAFGENMPVRDLWLSPGHNVAIAGVLMPISVLQNGRTVLQVRRPTVEYWHVELDAHDVILAEGLPAESYLDTGNRTAFVNGGAFIEQFPDFEPKHWSETCLPLVFEGPEVERTKAALLARTVELGHVITSEADLRLIVDGTRLDPVFIGDMRVAFMLPAGCRDIALRSRCFVPAHVNPSSIDARSLGICVGRLQIDGEDVPLDGEASFVTGWHRHEHPMAGTNQRWTRGTTPFPALARLIVIDLAGRGYYWEHRDDRVVSLASRYVQ